MKRLTLIASLLILITGAGFAQNIKLGHLNSDELIQSLPEYDSATVKLEKFRQDLVNALELMTVELNNKSDAYNKESKNLTDLVKQTKEQELVDLNRRIQQFQQDAQEQLQSRQIELFNPLYTRVEQAIKDVAKENGFVYIFNVAGLLYFDDTKSTNILSMVKTKLGVK